MQELNQLIRIAFGFRFPRNFWLLVPISSGVANERFPVSVVHGDRQQTISWLFSAWSIATD